MTLSGWFFTRVCPTPNGIFDALLQHHIIPALKGVYVGRDKPVRVAALDFADFIMDMEEEGYRLGSRNKWLYVEGGWIPPRISPEPIAP